MSDTPIQQETEVVILLSPMSLDSFDHSDFTSRNTGVVFLSFPRMVIFVVLLGDLDESKVTR